jgi:hypothetical protein
MDLNVFLSNLSSASSGVIKSRYDHQNQPEEVRELARLNLKLIPVSLEAKLNGCPDEFISAAISDISLLEQLSAVAQPLWVTASPSARPVCAFWFSTEWLAEPRSQLSSLIWKNVIPSKCAAETRYTPSFGGLPDWCGSLRQGGWRRA